MHIVKKILKFLAAAAVVAALGFTSYVWWLLQPRPEPRDLPSDIVSLEAPQGRALLEDADAFADYGPLSGSFVAQSLKSYCGVASAVTVLSALGEDVSQDRFFTADASRVRSRLQVTLGGMTLTDLADLLRAYGMRVRLSHADAVTADRFRDIVSASLSTPGEYVIVNYQREILGQPRVGHISPLAAYDAETDRVLVLDTASHYYPHSWVPLAQLHAAMDTTDPSSGKARGFVIVTRP